MLPAFFFVVFASGSGGTRATPQQETNP
jgi:hypothetical protein